MTLAVILIAVIAVAIAIVLALRLRRAHRTIRWQRAHMAQTTARRASITGTGVHRDPYGSTDPGSQVDPDMSGR